MRQYRDFFGKGPIFEQKSKKCLNFGATGPTTSDLTFSATEKVKSDVVGIFAQKLSKNENPKSA
jgi:hypothetical protein